jgi:hypothetical protein
MLNAELDFGLTGSWSIALVPKRSDYPELASVVNPPYRQ